MGVTISTHNGSQVAREHNIRNPKVISKEPHIEKDGLHETWHDEKERQAYDRIFGEALKEYNAKQTRSDRQIRSYYNTVKDDAKKHTSYEMIIGVYGEEGSFETKRDILKEFVDKWQERNPNLEMIGAYFHFDEQGEDPHCHIDYIPVAHGYARGLETQNGLVKALGEMGFEKEGRETAQIKWERSENQFLEQLCISRGLQVEHPKIEGIQHLEKEQYIATKELETTIEYVERNKEEAIRIQERIETKQHKLEDIEHKVEGKEERLKALDGEIKEAKDLRKEKSDKGLFGRTKNEITIPYTEYRTLQRTAREVESLKDKEYKLNNREYELNKEREAIQPRLDEVAAKEEKAESLYRKAEAYEKDRASYIMGTSKKIAEKMVGNIMQGQTTKKEDRMKEFLSNITLKDGCNALERFEEQERELHRSLERQLERELHHSLDRGISR